jgi:hypothetical protein
MLFLTEKLLKAAGFNYDKIGDAWVAPPRLRPVVTVECDEDRAYIMEALCEVHDILKSSGCTYNSYAINRRYISVVGLAVAEVAAVA